MPFRKMSHLLALVIVFIEFCLDVYLRHSNSEKGFSFFLSLQYKNDVFISISRLVLVILFFNIVFYSSAVWKILNVI